MATSTTATASMHSHSSASATQAATSTREFLAFKLGGEEYGVDILRVQEIRSFEPPTRLVNAPEFILGVVDLRGLIVPIFDMRIKFGLGTVAYDSFTVVIVLNIGKQVIGMVVDAVSDVIGLAPEQMRSVPEFFEPVDSQNLLAIGSVDQRMLILLDIEKLMSRLDTGLTSLSQFNGESQ